MNLSKLYLGALLLFAGTLNAEAQQMLASEVPFNEKGDFLLKKTHWYRLSQHIGAYVYYWDTRRYELLNGQTTLLLTERGKADVAEQYWTLSGDQVVNQDNSGITRNVYNMATGSRKVLTARNESPQSGVPFAMEDSRSPQYTKQNFQIGENNGGILSLMTPTGYWISYENGGSGPYISLYGRHTGSTYIYFEKIEDPFDLKFRIQNTLKAENVVGGFTTEQLADLKRAWNTDTITIRYAMECLDKLEKAERIPMLENGYYRLRSANTTDNTYYVASVEGSGKLTYKIKPQGDVVNDIFYFSAASPFSPETKTGQYKAFEGSLYTLNTREEVSGITGFTKMGESTTPTHHKMIEFSQEYAKSRPAQYRVIFDFGSYLSLPGTRTTQGDLETTHDLDSHEIAGWFIEPVNTFTVSAEPYGTFCLPFTVKSNNGKLNVRVYKGERQDAILTDMKPVAEAGEIEGGTPTIIYTTDKAVPNFTLEVVQPKAPVLYTVKNNNTWKGTFPPLPMDANAIKGNYILYNHGQKGPGFYLLNGQGTLPANKVYFTTSLSAPAGAPEFLPLMLDGTTGISTVETEAAQGEVYYDLSGRKVARPVKGLYLSKGQKLFVK